MIVLGVPPTYSTTIKPRLSISLNGINHNWNDYYLLNIYLIILLGKFPIFQYINFSSCRSKSNKFIVDTNIIQIHIIAENYKYIKFKLYTIHIIKFIFYVQYKRIQEYIVNIILTTTVSSRDVQVFVAAWVAKLA